MRHWKLVIGNWTLLAFCLLPSAAFAQALPRISAVYPPGARAGQTVEISIRGSGLDGARAFVVSGSGLSAQLNPQDVKVDPAEQKVFTTRCGLCHELRGPATISRTADQWVATVDRMIRDRNAPIEAADRQRIVNYLQAAARAGAGLTARVAVAADAAPGRREIRVMGTGGTSTAFPFEVTTQPEALETEPNNEVLKAPLVPLPVTVSGQIAAGDVDCFQFQAKQGERLVFNCSAYRLNEASQAFFFPVLYLYDASGRELARNTGYFSLDPLIDWIAPEDGKYVVMIRDMLYRGTPGSIYRLSMGALPYKTYLFPPGGRRGATTTVTIGGENLTPAELSISLPGDAPEGLRQIATGRGSFPFVVGDYPEYGERPGTEAPPLTLPASINGRVEDAAQPDRCRFSLAKEQLGAYSFDAFAERVGSPLLAALTLRDSRGRALATAAGAPGNRDPRLDYTFVQPGEYTLEIADAAGKASPAHVYRISAGPASPDFLLTVSPDNPNLGPGSSVYLQVRVQRRVGIAGNIEVGFGNLPPGVTASPTVIRPDEAQSFVILTASPDAQPGSFTLARVIGRAVVEGRNIEREAVPQEIYRINNNPQIANRGNMVVTVGPAPAWTCSIEPGSLQMTPGSAPVTVRVRLNRQGMEGDLPFAIVGIPQGIQGPRNLLFRRGQSEMTFTLALANPAQFAPRPGAPPLTQFLMAVVNGREGEGMQMCSPAVPVALRLLSASRYKNYYSIGRT